MIHQTIYDTRDLPAEEAMQLIGAPRVEDVLQRRLLLELFLTEHETWDLGSFTLFAQAQYQAGWYEREAIPECGEWISVPVEMPSKIQMAKNVGKAAVQAAKTWFKKVSKEEQQRRHNICKTACEFYRHEDDRCSQCGCWTTYKTKLEAWHCPIGKW